MQRPPCYTGLLWLGRVSQAGGATSRKTLVLPRFGSYKSISCCFKWSFIALGPACLKLTVAPLILLWLKSVSYQSVVELVLPARKKKYIYLRVILPRITGVMIVVINGNKLILWYYQLKNGSYWIIHWFGNCSFFWGFIMLKTTMYHFERALIGFKILTTNQKFSFQTSKPLVHTWRTVQFLTNPERKSTQRVSKLFNLHPSLGIYIAMHRKK